MVQTVVAGRCRTGNRRFRPLIWRILTAVRPGAPDRIFQTALPTDCPSTSRSVHVFAHFLIVRWGIRPVTVLWIPWKWLAALPSGCPTAQGRRGCRRPIRSARVGTERERRTSWGRMRGHGRGGRASQRRGRRQREWRRGARPRTHETGRRAASARTISSTDDWNAKSEPRTAYDVVGPLGEISVA